MTDNEVEEARNEFYEEIKNSALEYATSEIEKNRNKEKTLRFFIVGVTIVLVTLISWLSCLGVKVFREQQYALNMQFNEMADLVRSMEITGGE